MTTYVRPAHSRLKIARTKIYISGPMSHRVDHNFPAFHLAANRLEAVGLDVLDPARLDENTDTTGWVWTDYIRRDLRLLCGDDIRGIATLPNWELSRGAVEEVHLIRDVFQLPVQSVDEWIAYAEWENRLNEEMWAAQREAERQFVRDIKTGQYRQSFVDQWLTSAKNLIRDELAKSPLPDAPHWPTINDWTIDAHERHWSKGRRR